MTLLYRQSRSGAALIMHEDKACWRCCTVGDYIFVSSFSQ